MAGLFDLFLRFFVDNAFAERRVKLRDLDFTLYSFLILTRPDNVAGLSRFETEKAVL